MGQCLLALKDMGDRNHGAVVYGFITTGLTWRMLRYDPDKQQFLMTNIVFTVFEKMAREKDKWMSSYSEIVDCIYAALSDGGNIPGSAIQE